MRPDPDPASAPSRRLVASADGQLAASIDADRISVLDPARRAAICEIGIAGGSEANDVAFAGAQPWLIVLARGAGRSLLHVIDPVQPRKLRELALPAELWIGAVGGGHALVIGATSGIVDIERSDLQLTQLPVRAPVTAASALAPGEFLVASAGTLEEWTTIHKRPEPTRRLRLGSPIEAHHVGGGAQRVWVVSRQHRDRIEIISPATRSTRTVELTEPVARISAHPSGGMLLAVGAQTRAAYLVNLARARPPVRLPHGPVHDAVWHGAGRSILIWPVDGEPELIDAAAELAESSPELSLEPLGEAAGPDHHALAAPERGAHAEPAGHAARSQRAVAASPAADPVVEPPSRRELLDAWRRKLARFDGAGAVPADAISDAIPELAERRGSEGWRGALATWARAILGHSRRPFPVLDPSILDDVVARLGLTEQRAAVGLCYGARLLGDHGVAAYDAASALDWRWADVLAGPLLGSGAMVWRGDRLHLAGEVLAALDERPPLGGVVIGDGASADPLRVAVIAPPQLADPALATWAAGLLERRLFAAGRRGERSPARFALEARARGLTPLLRMAAGSAIALPPSCVVAVPDRASAGQLGLDVRGIWSVATSDTLSSGTP